MKFIKLSWTKTDQTINWPHAYLFDHPDENVRKSAEITSKLVSSPDSKFIWIPEVEDLSVMHSYWHCAEFNYDADDLFSDWYSNAQMHFKTTVADAVSNSGPYNLYFKKMGEFSQKAGMVLTSVAVVDCSLDELLHK